MDYVQINSGLIKADVAIATPQPSGVTLFSATDAPISPEFFVASTSLYEREIARLEWRILIQVVAMQVNEMTHSQYQEDELWIPRIFETLQRINQKAQIFRPSFIPSNITPPTAEYHALLVSGANWCDVLIQRLNCIFTNASADTLRISYTHE